ncbi:MAG: plastocyanin/azurin family copper-binding protein [Halobacteriaceae archaeon]
MKRRTFLAGVGAGVAGFAGCAASGGPGVGDHDVGMSTDKFLPRRIEVAVGETVVWANTSDRPHTVTAYEGSLPDGAPYFASGGFDSEAAAREGWFDGMGGAIQSGETYEHTFEVAGEFPYFCIPHEAAQMVGTVVVG